MTEPTTTELTPERLAEIRAQLSAALADLASTEARNRDWADHYLRLLEIIPLGRPDGTGVFTPEGWIEWVKAEVERLRAENEKLLEQQAQLTALVKEASLESFHKVEAKAQAEIAGLRAELADTRFDTWIVDYLHAHRGISIDYPRDEEQDGYELWLEHGHYNDREWTKLAHGTTVREAFRALAEQPEARP